MGLPHRRRQTAFPGAVQLARAALAIAVWLLLSVLVPQHHQRDAGPAQLVMDIGQSATISSDVQHGGQSASVVEKRCREMRSWLITIGLVLLAVGLLWP